ncbi:PREDICTED: uncharacterized protein LOC108558044 [Nicrophorus vespilloides]|uniref:Uncharacterized protein LOC108558044 n=1 Tax=Nicrophorus vespilloides TaxID=110193 RepID=A0ABM1M6W8_NICVS|nr:PREDICTED: uncharacterized protein LOC108558044 [Nicrophorus vespilloides]
MAKMFADHDDFLEKTEKFLCHIVLVNNVLREDRNKRNKGLKIRLSYEKKKMMYLSKKKGIGRRCILSSRMSDVWRRIKVDEENQFWSDLNWFLDGIQANITSYMFNIKNEISKCHMDPKEILLRHWKRQLHIPILNLKMILDDIELNVINLDLNMSMDEFLTSLESNNTNLEDFDCAINKMLVYTRNLLRDIKTHVCNACEDCNICKFI